MSNEEASAQKNDTAQKTLENMHGMGIVGVLMGSLQLFIGSAAVARYFSHRPERPVISSRSYFSHGHKCEVALGDGDGVVLTSEDVQHPERCLRPGTLVEKRPHEFGYRINGVLGEWEQTETFSTMLVLGTLWVSFGAVMLLHVRRRRRTGVARAGTSAP